MNRKEFQQWCYLELPKLTECMEHSCTAIDLQGNVVFESKGENLFHQIQKRKIYVVDSQQPWRQIARTHKDWSVVLGVTVFNEKRQVAEMESLVDPTLESETDNLFALTPNDSDASRLTIELHRMDRKFCIVYKMEIASDWWKSLENRNTDVKRTVLNLLGFPTAQSLPKPSDLNEVRNRLTEFVNSKKQSCPLDWDLCSKVSVICYAIELARNRKLQTEFFKPKYHNVFGDVVVLQNALFLNADILTGDKPLKRMASYVGKQCVDLRPRGELAN